MARAAFEPEGAPDFAQVLCDQGGVAESAASGVARFLRRQAGLQLLFRFKIQTGLQFAVEVVVAIGTMPERGEVRTEPMPHAHEGSSGAGRITVATASASCFHRDVSRTELFPAGRSKTVILEFAIAIFRGFPLRADPPLGLPATQSRVE